MFRKTYFGKAQKLLLLITDKYELDCNDIHGQLHKSSHTFTITLKTKTSSHDPRHEAQIKDLTKLLVNFTDDIKKTHGTHADEKVMTIELQINRIDKIIRMLTYLMPLSKTTNLGPGC